MVTLQARQIFFSQIQARPFWKQRKLAQEEEKEEGVPQQQRKAGWLALPAQKGEETSGHVELSYVLTCPSPPSPLDIFFDTQGERKQESGKVAKKRGKKLQG